MNVLLKKKKKQQKEEKKMLKGIELLGQMSLQHKHNQGGREKILGVEHPELQNQKKERKRDIGEKLKAGRKRSLIFKMQVLIMKLTLICQNSQSWILAQWIKCANTAMQRNGRKRLMDFVVEMEKYSHLKFRLPNL